jgi:aspartyl protease family protein
MADNVKLRISVLVISFFIIPLASAGAIYKCKGQNGHLLYQEEPCAKDAQAISSWHAESSSGADKPLVLSRSRSGHYFTDGSINGHFLNFVVDTGASYVAVPLGFAENAGLKCKDMASMQTANGLSRVCHVVIDSLSFGNFTLDSVDALVAPNLDQALLGMNVLKRFRVEQDADQMRLTKNY